MIELLRSLLLPPGIFVVLFGLGLLLLPVARKLAVWLFLAGLVLLYGLSTAPLAGQLVAWIETTPALSMPVQKQAAGAIVVLGAGRYNSAPEYGGVDSVDQLALVRLRYAETLREQTGLPILTSGGRPNDELYAEAELMAQALKSDFDGLARWTESKSRNTFENAICSKFILDGQGIHRVLLVTHAAHMPRALYAFEKAGLEAIPAPTGYLKDTFRNASVLQRWLPSLTALQLSRTALHEWLGLLYYRMVYGDHDGAAGIRAQC